MDCSLPGFSVHGILQARILQWVAMPFSRGSSPSRDWIQVSCTAGRFFTISATRGSLIFHVECIKTYIYIYIYICVCVCVCVYKLFFQDALQRIICACGLIPYGEVATGRSLCKCGDTSKVFGTQWKEGSSRLARVVLGATLTCLPNSAQPAGCKIGLTLTISQSLYGECNWGSLFRCGT